ncbi:hypothetical protein [Streptomyces sp. NPDC058653]|uniref:hypothetical protein n=1 Tax=Streptomyces sp. NPDC058653 TaxID=3346576 RepID=UPI0036696EC7
MTGNAKTGIALVGGYLLGRTKKAKLAIGFGMFLAGRKMNFDPRQLGKLVANSPVLGSLNDQVRKELVDATKSAATNALTHRASGLADSLHRRTLELDGKEEPAEEREDDERDADRDQKADDKPAPRRKSAAKAPAKSAGSAGRSAAKATSGARRTASGGARKKTATRARKTASSAGRSERGGDNG